MKRISILIFLAVLAIAACKKADKYGRLTDQAVYGYAYVTDPFGVNLSVALSAQTVYINDKADTTAYVLQTATDAAGRFTFNRPSTGQFTVFAHYIKDGVEYRGSVTRDADKTDSIKLLVLPQYLTALHLHFQDATNGGLSNLNFRLYTNQSAAAADLTKQAFLKGTADTYGNFNTYNINTGDYWVVAKDTIGSAIIGVNQKITVMSKKLTSEQIKLQ